jgi:Kef-type K+ transport system membrane component KefB
LVSRLKLAALVLIIASLGKIVGCGLVAYISGLRAREACGVGICMNSCGAMEIILGSVALEKGLISPELFVALVTMALITSAAVGPPLRLLDLARVSPGGSALTRRRPKHFRRSPCSDLAYSGSPEIAAWTAECQPAAGWH